MTNPNHPAFSLKVISQKYLDKFPDALDIKGVAIGLTKREYFAAMAMQGVLAWSPGETSFGDPSANAMLALKCADALIAELNK